MLILSNREAGELDRLASELSPLRLEDRLRLIRSAIPGRLVFTTSFGLEDQVLTHAIVEAGIAVSFATLDTGRLFDETLELWAETEFRYGIGIRGYMPDCEALEILVARDGPTGFRQSVEARQACCAVRKVEPLDRALEGASGWLTGLRAGQSAGRSGTPLLSRERRPDLVKVNPLADWGRSEVEAYVRRAEVPTNPLHEAGYASIGCSPCTRAVRPGEDERAGRWWWEAETKKECGLHSGPSEAIVPPVAVEADMPANVPARG